MAFQIGIITLPHIKLCNGKLKVWRSLFSGFSDSKGNGIRKEIYEDWCNNVKFNGPLDKTLRVECESIFIRR